MNNLLEIFNSLEPSELDQSMIYKTLTLADFSNHRIGKNTKGKAVLFIAVDSQSLEFSDISLQNFSVNFNAICKIDRELIGIFTIITYIGNQGDLQTYFLNLCEQIITKVGNNPQQKEVHNEIYRLIELLKFANQAPQKSIQGLWAELLIIEQADDIPLFIKSWHTEPTDKYDFTHQTQHLEVKSTRNQRRIHHFSIEQLTPIDCHNIYIVSIFVEYSSNGMNIKELVDKITSKIPDQVNLQSTLHLIIAKTLGKSIIEAQKLKFNYEIARQSILYYDAANIPKINPSNIAQEITDLHFKVDLTNVVYVNKFTLKT